MGIHPALVLVLAVQAGSGGWQGAGSRLAGEQHAALLTAGCPSLRAGRLLGAPSAAAAHAASRETLGPCLLSAAPRHWAARWDLQAGASTPGITWVSCAAVGCGAPGYVEGRCHSCSPE